MRSQPSGLAVVVTDHLGAVWWLEGAGLSEESHGSMQLGGFAYPVLLKLEHRTGLEEGSEALAYGDVRNGLMQLGLTSDDVEDEVRLSDGGA